MYLSYYKAQLIAKICFSSLQGMKASFRMFFERFRASKRKLEIDDPKPPKNRKFLSHYEKGEAPVEFVFTVEEHYQQVSISAEILH